MGIVKSELAEFELSDGEKWRIEYNENNTIHIHIHINSLRIVKTPEEFRTFVKAVKKGEKKFKRD